MTQLTPTPKDPHGAAAGASAGELRSVTTRPCPSCSTPVSVNASTCSACGESLPARDKRIRCRRCGGSASAALVVCPHCGRELQAAPPRLLTWGAPVVLILLFAAALLTQLGNASPAAWTQRQAARVVALVNGIGERLQPDITITTMPVGEEDGEQLVSQPPPIAPTQAVVMAETSSNAEAPLASAGVGDATAGESAGAAPTVAAPGDAASIEPASDAGAAAPTPTLQPPLPTDTPTALPTETPTKIPTIPPTATSLPMPTATVAIATATSTALPTSISPKNTLPTNTPLALATASTTPGRSVTASTLAITATRTLTPTVALAMTLPTPTPTVLLPTALPTATPNIHRIRAGDTLFELALDNDISLEALLVANNLTEDDVYTIQPGDDIIIPDPNATAAPPVTDAPTPTPEPTGFTYTIRAGDTLMAIGLRFGVNVQRILDANGMTLAQARSLRPGQELIIPGEEDVASTPTPQPTVAAAAPATAPTPAAVASGVRLDAPGLLSPENGTSVQCGAGGQLAWSAVPFISPTDSYVVHLGYVNGRDGGGVEQVVWVLAQPRPANVT
ncbi:MAG TPA: LysM peptidoglycan-binding domain-containing protein, partial [Caldilinea sp.]|nr:LysM peptidoglycan-binding domain-containing protein [Caldilinea sp.]